MSTSIPRRLWQCVLALGLGLAGGLLLWLGSSEPVEMAAQVTPNWPTIALVKLQVSGLQRPLQVTHAGDGSRRLFVVEQSGRIRIIYGRLLNTPFLDITGRVGDENNEQGLLGLAFPPGYADKGYFYVNYTNNSGDTVIARYWITQDPNVADPNSEEILLRIDQPYPNHNGGQLAFGPKDGYLYIGTGDGGSAGDPQNRAQNPASLLGKILRIDVEPAAGRTYDIPASNPYTQTTGYQGEIWALGLRNPWRFSFDRRTGDLYIGDVGQGTREEIDFQRASSLGGLNYGWNIMEGSLCYNAQSCNKSGLTLPVSQYGTHVNGNCAVTGGFVYRGRLYPSLRGIYFYADYCSGRIWGLQRDGATWQRKLLRDSSYQISSFGHDQAGNLYITDLVGGGIYKIVER